MRKHIISAVKGIFFIAVLLLAAAVCLIVFTYRPPQIGLICGA